MNLNLRITSHQHFYHDFNIFQLTFREKLEKILFGDDEKSVDQLSFEIYNLVDRSLFEIIKQDMQSVKSEFYIQESRIFSLESDITKLKADIQTIRLTLQSV